MKRHRLVVCMLVFLLLSVFIPLLVSPVGATVWYDTDWGYCKKITIPSGNVTGNLVNFPVLVHNTSSDFASHAQSDGDDFIFLSSDNSTVYSHEIELYNSTTGELVAWVNVTGLSNTTDNVMYLYYGNSGCGNQEDVSGVWDINYTAVYHMNSVSDSTSNDRDLTNYGGSFVLGDIGYCLYLDGTGSYLTIPTSATLFSGSETKSMWFQRYGNAGGSSSSSHHCLMSDMKGVQNNNYRVSTDGITFYYFLKDTDNRYSSVNVNSIDNNYLVGLYDDSTFNLTTCTNGSTYGTIYTLSQSAAVGSRTSSIGRLALNYFYTNGTIDEVRVSNIARNSSWIATEYDNQLAPGNFMSVGSERSTPTITVTYPTDTSHIKNPQPTLLFTLNNFLGTINYTVYTGTTSPTAYLTNDSYVTDGTPINVICYYNATSYYTDYIWSVNVSSNGGWLNESYTFDVITSGGGSMGNTDRTGIIGLMGVVGIVFWFIRRRKHDEE